MSLLNILHLKHRGRRYTYYLKFHFLSCCCAFVKGRETCPYVRQREKQVFKTKNRSLMKDLLHPSPYPRSFVPIVSSNLSLHRNPRFAPPIELASLRLPVPFCVLPRLFFHSPLVNELPPPPLLVAVP